MYRLDVVTDLGTFTVHEDEITDVTEENQVTSVRDIVSDIMGGSFYKGYPPDYNREKEPILFSIVPGSSIVKAFVLYPYIKIEAPKEERIGPAENEVAPFTAYVEYLGNKLTVTGCQMLHEDILYVLPVKVNGVPHTEIIKQQALEELLEAWLEEYRGLSQAFYLVIVPEVPMDYITSSEYLVDYVGGITKERAGTNAKAWNGWKENPE